MIKRQAKEQHTHKLKRHRHKSGNVVYFCCLPDCSYKINPSLALGKRSLCWRCDEPFIMNDYSLRLAKPHCPNCHKSKENKSDKSNLYPDSIQSEIVRTDAIEDLSYEQEEEL